MEPISPVSTSIGWSVSERIFSRQTLNSSAEKLVRVFEIHDLDTFHEKPCLADRTFNGCDLEHALAIFHRERHAFTIPPDLFPVHSHVSQDRDRGAAALRAGRV